MNICIEELAEQATEQATTRHPVSNIALVVDPDVFKQKFAELIIQECYEWAKENGGIGDDVDYTELKQHFGIKE